jgi:hypothetical protein
MPTESSVLARGLRGALAALVVAGAAGTGSGAAAVTASQIAAPPLPPQAYALPAGAVRVRTGAELARILAERAPRDIVLADGVYAAAGAFTNGCGHRLYAEHPGQAVLTTGLSIGGNDCSGGGRVQGLLFSIPGRAGTTENAAIEVWGTARFTTIADVHVQGHGVLDAGIVVRQPEGLQITRVAAAGFRSYGILVDANVFDLAVVVPPLLQDLNVADVGRPTPGESDGTAEACIWVGNTAIGERFRMRNCAWMGLWTGTAAKNARFSDIDVDNIPLAAGLYLEHYTTNSTFERINVGPNVNTGIICEWAAPEWDSRPGCNGVLIQDSWIRSRCVGVNFEDGTRNSTVRRTHFTIPSWAAIGDYHGTNNLQDTTANTFEARGSGTHLSRQLSPCLIGPAAR